MCLFSTRNVFQKKGKSSSSKNTKKSVGVVLDQEGELVISSRDSDLVFLPPEKESIFPHTVKAEKFGTYPFFVHGNGGEFQNYAKIQDKLFGWNDKSKEFVKKAARHNFKLFYDEVEISYNDLCKEFLK